VQPGRGEQVVTWDTFHHGMGYSRLSVPGTYEYSASSTSIGGTVNCTIPWLAAPGPDVTVITPTGTAKHYYRLIEYNGYIYAIGKTIADGDLYYSRIDPSDYSVNAESEVGAGQADGPPGQCTVWENTLYVGMRGASKNAYAVDTSNNWARGTDNETRERDYCRVGRDMWSISNVSGEEAKVRKLAAGATWDSAARGAQYIVGDTGRPIASMIEWGRWLYSGKPEGLFSGDTDGNQWNALPGLNRIASSSNNLRLEEFGGPIMAPTTLGLYRHLGQTSRTVGLERYTYNQSVCRAGYIKAIAAAGNWLYAASQVGSNAWLLVARRRESDDPPGPDLVWHTLFYFANLAIEDILISDLPTAPTLFWVTSSTPAGVGAKVYYIKLAPDGSPNPLDSNYAAETTGTMSLYLPAVDLGNPGTLKRGHMVEVHAGGTMDANREIKVYADWDGGGYNQVGVDIASTGYTQRFWTKDSNDSGRRCQLRLDITNNHATAFPQLQKVSLYLIELPRVEPAIECSIRLADSLDKKRTAKGMKADLGALVNAGVYTMTDPDDPAAGTLSVIVREINYSEREQAGTQTSEKQADLTLRVVEYS